MENRGAGFDGGAGAGRGDARVTLHSPPGQRSPCTRGRGLPAGPPRSVASVPTDEVRVRLPRVPRPERHWAHPRGLGRDRSVQTPEVPDCKYRRATLMTHPAAVPLRARPWDTPLSPPSPGRFAAQYFPGAGATVGTSLVSGGLGADTSEETRAAVRVPAGSPWECPPRPAVAGAQGLDKTTPCAVTLPSRRVPSGSDSVTITRHQGGRRRAPGVPLRRAGLAHSSPFLAGGRAQPQGPAGAAVGSDRLSAATCDAQARRQQEWRRCSCASSFLRPISLQP